MTNPTESGKKTGIFASMLRGCHPLLVLTIAAILLIGADYRAAQIVRAPGIILRAMKNSPNTLYYLLEQIKLTPGFKIAWVGTSVMQASLTSPPDETVPLLTQNLLAEKGWPVKCFNLALAGNVIVDNYALAHQAMKNGSKFVVWELVFGPLGGRGGANADDRPLPYLAYMANDLPNFTRIRREMMFLPDKTWNENLPSIWFNSEIALFKHREVLMKNWTGQGNNFGVFLGDRIMHDAGLKVVRNGESPFEKPWEERDVEYYWSRINRDFFELVSENFLKNLSTTDNSKDTPRMNILRHALHESELRGTPILFYLSPINIELLEMLKIMNWEIYNEYRKNIIEVIEENGGHVLDLTDKIHSRYFIDGQHLNRTGQHKLADQLVEPLSDFLVSGKRQSQ